MQLATQYMKKQTFSEMMTSTRQKLNRDVMYILSYLDIGVYPVHVHVFTLFEYISAIGLSSATNTQKQKGTNILTWSINKIGIILCLITRLHVQRLIFLND